METRHESPQGSETIRQRIDHAVDVAGSFDNCFFHCYAAYLLANKIRLPQDLFTKKNEFGNTAGERLKEIFPNKEALDIFSQYYKQKNPAEDPKDMLFEKTLVLGVLFREWFIKKLSEDENHRAALFKKMIESYKEYGKQVTLHDDQFKPIYNENQAFFDGLDQAWSQDAESNISQKWDEIYKKYYTHLAKPDSKIMYTDVAPVLENQEIPYVFYNKGANGDNLILKKHKVSGKASFELAISGGEGHYLLLKTPQTETALQEYESSIKEYQSNREIVLQQDVDMKKGLCESMHKYSPLLEAFFPSGQISESPVDELIKRSRDIKSQVPALALADNDQAFLPFEQKLQLIIEKTSDLSSGSKERTPAIILIDALLNAREELADDDRLDVDAFKRACLSACTEFKIPWPEISELQSAIQSIAIEPEDYQSHSSFRL